MTTLTPEERELGRSNANRAIALAPNRRDFLKAAAVAPVAGAFYFGYEGGMKEPVRAAIIGTGNEGCGAMIHDHNREYVNYIGFCDIRPFNQKRAIKEFSNHKDYKNDYQKLKQYKDEAEMLADPEVEMVVIALPLSEHAPVAIRAMKAGKHVFTEKLMAHTVGQAKAMIRAAHETNKLLAVGHQRHYSALYDNANYLVQNGHLGDIRHIRALWHRNNATPRIAKDEKTKELLYDDKGDPIYVRDEAGNIVYFDGWKPPYEEGDREIDYAKYGYKSLDELVRWRLYNRTGAGLMAELGGHQLDACSIFLGKKHPLSVVGIGGTYFYKDGREVDDHVYVTFEFPGPEGPKAQDRVVVMYSSINTNEFEKYGEMVYGSRATMIVEGERDLMLYKEIDRNTWKGGGGPRNTAITMETKGGKPVLETSPSLAGATGAVVPGTMSGDPPSRGYREELEHFAFCIRNGNPSDYHGDKDHQPRCRGEVALADAVVALTSNIAMRQKRRIEFDEAWFDYNKPDVPDNSGEDLAMKG
jgi:predicted dehydrogenase